MKTFSLVTFACLLLACSGTKTAYWQGPEAERTEKLLGVKVEMLPVSTSGQGFVDVDPEAPKFKARFDEVSSERAGFDPSMGQRTSVFAAAPDGMVWEAFCGRPGEQQQQPFPELGFSPSQSGTPKYVETFNGFQSDPSNTRQEYGTHHGYSYYPADIFIGKRMSGRLVSSLFFRDVGSHTHRNHYLTFDNAGEAHLIVADVNISEDNHLDLFWVVGSPLLGKWKSAYLIEQRGFTSSTEVWNGGWNDTIHLLWSWDSGEKQSPDIGLYHIEKTAKGFSKKQRIATGRIQNLTAAIDPQNGRLVAAFNIDGKPFGITSLEKGKWSQPTPIRDGGFEYADMVLEPATEKGFPFTVNENYGRRKWFLIPEE
jgi:hypothetical protein